MPEWLEVELAEALRPVAAPPQLWDRVWEPRPRLRHQKWAAWPIAAAIALAVAAGIVWSHAAGRATPVNLRQLALEQLRDAKPLDFHSSDPAEIRRWLRQQTGAEVRLAPHRTAHLVGARVIRAGGASIGVVAYRVGDIDATLLVARGQAMAERSHRRFSWSAGGVNYALACADVAHPEAACLLCHANL
jgi:hypothetical protein